MIGGALEISVIGGLAILIAKTLPGLSSVPPLMKTIHFAMVVLYSLVGIEGCRLMLLFSLDHHFFVEIFSRPNVLGIKSVSIQWLAVSFAMLGLALFVAGMRVGRFRA